MLKAELEQYADCDLKGEVSERLTKYSEDLIKVLTEKNRRVTISAFDSKKSLKDAVENGYD